KLHNRDGRADLVPVVAEELDGVHRTNRAVRAPKVIGGTVLVTSPTDAFRMWRSQGQLRHVSSLTDSNGRVHRQWPAAACVDPRAASPRNTSTRSATVHPLPRQISAMRPSPSMMAVASV